MRRTISILLTALVAFGCAKEELAVLEPSRTTEASGSVGMSPISITLEKSAESWGTKASIVDGFAVGDAVTVAAFQGNDVCFSDAVAKTSSSWAMSEPHFWDIYDAEYSGSAYLDFCFVYPNQTISNKSFTYTVAANPADQEDLLVKHIHTQAPENYGAVEVVMDHALSILDFKVKAEESGYEYKVEGITVNNAAGFYDKGTYTFGSGWGSLSKVNSVNSISSPINVATVSSSEYTDVNDGDYCFLLPQDVASMDVNVSYSVVKSGQKRTSSKAVTLTGNTFTEGNRYTYRINLPAITGKLSTPTNLKASEVGTDYITFTWDAVANADYYILTNEGSGMTIKANCTGTSYNWTGLNSNSTYTVGVVAVSNDDFYENSGKATAAATTKSESGTVAWNSGSITGNNWVPFTDDNLKNVLKNATNGATIKISFENPSKTNNISIKTSWTDYIFATISVGKSSSEQTIEYSLKTDEYKKFFRDDNVNYDFKGLAITTDDNSITIYNVQIIIP